MENKSLSMTLAELLNEARRSGGASLVDVPPSSIARTPPAMIFAVTGEHVAPFRELIEKMYGVTPGEKGLIILPGHH